MMGNMSRWEQEGVIVDWWQVLILINENLADQHVFQDDSFHWPLNL